jgi:hypothetical protein
MTKKSSIEQYRNRMRSQVEQSPIEAIPVQEMVSTNVNIKPAVKKRRTRSKWINPYPNVEPFQFCIYTTDEDIERIKTLKLKLHYARDWMVIKKALEELEKNLLNNKIAK